MKTLYRCEKCGKVYEDYEECERCENLHYSFVNQWESNGLNQKLDEMAEYKDGQEEPNVIHVWMVREYWDKEKGEWKNEKRCGKYKLVSSYEAPLEVKED